MKNTKIDEIFIR